MRQDPRRRFTCLVSCAVTGWLAVAGVARAQIPLAPSGGPTDRVSCAMTGLGVVGNPTIRAQTPLVPYYGKNDIRYDNFKWHIYTTDHFEIFYYPEVEPHLERVASYAESAYQHISSELKHDLAIQVPLVLFKTHSEFQQQHIAPSYISQEGTAAFADSERNRMVLPLDYPPDQLYGLIVHELTHIFEYDIIPRSLVRRGHPLWVDEGLADYMRGTWDALDLMTVRDVAVADVVPRMTKFENWTGYGGGRTVYNLGHAVFEFIESRWGKEGIRQFLFSLRKSVIGGGENAFDEALSVSADEFDDQFSNYLKERFKAFRDKERPTDYGRDLSPDPEDSPYTGALSVEPAPSGELIAAVVGNRKDQEIDIVLLSAKDRQVVRNVTRGFDKDSGYEYISYPMARGNTVPWMAWSPSGDAIAYFARTEKQRSLILRNVVTRRVERRFYVGTVDAPESPAFSPDGKTIAFAGLRNAVGDLFQIDVETGKVSQLTNDTFADSAPIFAPDGKTIVYLSRISGNDKLFRLDLASKERTQLTFGTHDEGAARFVNDRTLVFPSTALDPSKPIDPELAQDGNIYNIWTLDLSAGTLRQYTDALTANLSPIVLPAAKADEPRRIAFVTYFKGEYGLHEIPLAEPKLDVASSDFGAPGPVIDFQAPLTHALVPANQRRKGTFEKLFLEGRPPVSVGITSGGDLFGGTQVMFADVLGDQQFSFYAASISQYRTLALGYHNLSRRLTWGGQAYQQTLFYYGLQPGLLFDPSLSPFFLDRDDAVATRTSTGASLFAWYPLNRYRRLEISGGLFRYNEEFQDPQLQQLSDEYQIAQYGRRLLQSGTLVPLGISLVQETTIFREFGPLSGSTVRLGYEIAPSIGDTLSRQSVDGDLRYYKRLATTGVLAFRFRGFKSWGDVPDFFFYGGNSELRGYEYLEFVGDSGFHANAELRFPIIEAMLTPLGVLGGVRGTIFAGIGGASFDGRPATTAFGQPLNETNPNAKFRFWDNNTDVVRAIENFVPNETGSYTPVYGEPREISGFRLVDGRASYGVGLETFILGFPAHFDWSWRTLFNRDWEDALYYLEGLFDGGKSGSDWFREPRFSFWIGYDF
ncbi:MAG: hypothetical protein GEU99_04090 [Luteitalea sp.]|nr:hypothetical protein [Luteitalea sp.]